MRSLDRLIGRQIRHPSGVLGWALGQVMAVEHQRLVSWTFSQLGLSASDVVLDMGCGAGMALKTAGQIATEGIVVGFDYSPTMTRVTHARNRRIIADGRGGVVQANVAAPPFAADSFDKAFSIESLYFWPNPRESLREVRRVLKPGGRVALAMDISLEARDSAAIADTAGRLNMAVFSRADLERLLTDSGFSVVDVDAAPERGKGWICAIGEKPAG